MDRTWGAISAHSDHYGSASAALPRFKSNRRRAAFVVSRALAMQEICSDCRTKFLSDQNAIDYSK